MDMTWLFFLVVLFALIALSFTKPGRGVLDFFKFFVEGQKYNFSIPNLRLLWKATSHAGLDDRTRVFWSVGALDECIKIIVSQAESASNEKKEEIKSLLTKLYDYRTKVELEHVRKKRKLESTLEISIGQVCIMIFPNIGAVHGQITENTRFGLKIKPLVDISSKLQKPNEMLISIYFWRAEDAGYFFKSNILSAGHQDTNFFLVFKQTRNIIRTQKRKSVRAECDLPALLFPLHADTVDNTIPEISGGVKCSIKDISEDGAMLLVKGECKKGIKIKLQFSILQKDIVMFGKIVRFVYDMKSNRSRVHFQCLKLDKDAKNIILSYVYNTMPPSEIET